MNRRQKIVQEQFLNNEDAVIGRLEQVYTKSLSDINKKVKTLDSSIAGLQKALSDVGEEEIGELAAAYLKGKPYITPEEAKETLQSMLQSKVYQKGYQEALQKQVGGILDTMHKEEFKTVSEYLNKCYEEGFVGTLYDLQGQGIPLCFPLDQEAMVRAVQLDSKISQGLYSKVGENVSALKETITAEVSRGISTGMSYAQVAQQIKARMTGNYDDRPGGALYRAMTIARTEGHRIQSQSKMDACYNAKDKGAEVVKQWDSTLDGDTRESHRHVDMEIRELDEKFSNGLMFPGDPSGGAAEVVSCRCALLQRARWALEGSFTKMNNFTKEIETFESPEDYDEFKKAFFSKENRAYMNYHTELEERYGTKNFKKLLENMTDEEYSHYMKLYGKSPVYNKAAKGLENSGNSGIINLENSQLKPFTKVKVEDIPSMDEQKFNTIKSNLEKKGISIIQDADGDDYLEFMSAEAMTLSDGSAIIFQSGRVPSASAVYEEIIHTHQIKTKGMVESQGDIQGTLEYLHREIEANEKLLKYSKAYKLTQKDTESIKENLDMYYAKLKEVNVNV